MLVIQFLTCKKKLPFIRFIIIHYHYSLHLVIAMINHVYLHESCSNHVSMLREFPFEAI